MATVNFSVPEEIKEEFSATFAGENKSSIIAQLMRKAVEERRLKQRRSTAMESLLGLRRQAPSATSSEVA